MAPICFIKFTISSLSLSLAQSEQLANVCIEVLSNAEDLSHIQTLMENYKAPKGQKEASKKKLEELGNNIKLMLANKMPEFTVQ